MAGGKDGWRIGEGGREGEREGGADGGGGAGQVRRLGVRMRRVFLADGDAMTLPVNRLRFAPPPARACAG